MSQAVRQVEKLRVDDLHLMRLTTDDMRQEQRVDQGLDRNAAAMVGGEGPAPPALSARVLNRHADEFELLVAALGGGTI